jgi:hypothetical protein
MSLLQSFYFIKALKAPLTFHITYYLHYGQFNQFHILKEATNKYPRCCHDHMPHFDQWIDVKRWSHAHCCIGFQCQLEHALLTIKVTSIQDLQHTNLHCKMLHQSPKGVLGKTFHYLVVMNIGDTQSKDHP